MTCDEMAEAIAMRIEERIDDGTERVVGVAVAQNGACGAEVVVRIDGRPVPSQLRPTVLEVLREFARTVVVRPTPEGAAS